MSPTPPPPDGQPPAARTAPRAEYWRFGHYTLDTAQRELEHDGHRVRLDARTLAVLECLLAHADGVVPRDVLIAQAWQRLPVADSAVSKAMRRLRIALGPQASTVLLTVYGVGYRLAVPAVPEGTVLAAAPAAQSLPQAPPAMAMPLPLPLPHPARLPRGWLPRLTRARAVALAAVACAVAAACALSLYVNAAPPAP